MARVKTIETPLDDTRAAVGFPEPTLRYSPADMDKLDQFAIGLLGPNTSAGYSSDEIFMSRVRAAYLRAEVVLTVRKEIAALSTESGASE